MNEISPRSNKDLSPWQIQRLGEAQEAEYVYAPESQTSDLQKYWNVVVKHRRLVMGLFLAVFIVVGLVNFSSTPLYTSSAMLQIEPQNPAVTGLAEILSSKSEGSAQYDYYQTQFTLLRSRALAARVITSLQLASDPVFRTPTISDDIMGRTLSWILYPFQPVLSFVTRLFSPPTKPIKPSPARVKSGEPDVPSHLISRYLRYLKVTPVKNTRLVEVTFNTPDPQLSQKLADAHAAGFIRMNLDNRSALTDEAREFLDKKNAELRAKLERSEEALNRFRQTHGVVSLDKGENIVVDRLVALNGQLTTARAQRIDAESLYRTVRNKQHQDLSQIMTQGSIPQLKANLANLEAEKAKVSTIFKPDHPRLQELNEHISAARRSINAEIDNVVRGIESSFVAARAREEALEAEAKKQEQEALTLKHIGVQYAVLQEDVNVNRSLYESVLKRLSETNVSNDLSISNIQITQRADLPLFPSSPQTTRNLMLGAVVGLFLGIGMAFLLDYLDTKMSTPEHVERAVALNTLGVVPDLSGLNRLQIEWKRPDRSLLKTLKEFSPRRTLARNTEPNELLLTKHHPQSILPEAYRSIRASLLFSRPERPPQVILFTSAAPGEGKTGTSLNLGIALAQDGHRVLLVDADMRKGCCHSRLGMTNHKGLSNVLTGRLTLEEGIQLTSIPGLSLLSSGVCPPSPPDLLGSNKMKEVLARLRESFEFIIMDTPPAIALSDAAVLSVICDGVVLVFHGRKTTAASARQLIQRLDALHAPILGVVLNCVDLQNPNYSYYSHYGSYYATDDSDDAGADPNGDGLDAAVQRLKHDISGHHATNNSPNTFAGQVIVNDQSASIGDPLDPRSAAQIAKQDIQKPIDPAIIEVGKDHSSSQNAETELMPRESLDRLISAVTKSIGPIAPIVVHEQIRILGESYTAFPKNRIGELIKLLQHEIERTKSSQT
jgi:capsular exopolysaccharide synthesis family protein